MEKNIHLPWSWGRSLNLLMIMMPQPLVIWYILAQSNFQRVICRVKHLNDFFNWPEEVYRVTVMPCYDKKLEAARNDFASLFGYQVEGHESEINMISEVDLVLRTGEVLELIQVISLMHSLFFCHFFLTFNITNVC